jgi:hypothetical protein
MAGLVPAIPIIGDCTILIEIAGTSPAMTPRVLPLLLVSSDVEMAPGVPVVVAAFPADVNGRLKIGHYRAALKPFSRSD